MKISVLGSGNGALAVAYEWARAGHDVYMFDFPQFPKQIGAIAEKGGITCEGQMEGFQKIVYAGHDIGTCVEGADLVIAVGPAYSTQPFGEACKPYVKPGMKFVICPGSCLGAVVFKKALGVAIDDYSITVSDTSTLPYAVRILGDGHIAVYNHLEAGYMIATIPASKNDEMHALFSSVHTGIEKAKNVMQTCLQNANPVLHPCITTLSVTRIESPEAFLFYEQGVTPGVGHLLKAIDDERIALGKALGFDIESDPDLGVRQGYMTEANYDSAYSTAPGFKGILAQTDLNYRYYNEDAGYGLVLWTDMADKAGVPVPTMKAMLQIVSAIMCRDYKAENARTLTTMGLGDYTMEEICNML